MYIFDTLLNGHLMTCFPRKKKLENLISSHCYFFPCTSTLPVCHNLQSLVRVLAFMNLVFSEGLFQHFFSKLLMEIVKEIERENTLDENVQKKSSEEKGNFILATR